MSPDSSNLNREQVQSPWGKGYGNAQRSSDGTIIRKSTTLDTNKVTFVHSKATLNITDDLKKNLSIFLLILSLSQRLFCQALIQHNTYIVLYVSISLT